MFEMANVVLGKFAYVTYLHTRDTMFDHEFKWPKNFILKNKYIFYIQYIRY